MRFLITFLALSAFGLIIYNLTLIDYSDPLSDDSVTPIITTLCGLCVLMLLGILHISKKIERKLKGKN